MFLRDGLAQLPFLIMYIKENLRLHPLVTMISRCAQMTRSSPNMTYSVCGERAVDSMMVTSGRIDIELTVTPVQKGISVSSASSGFITNPSVWPDPEGYSAPPISGCLEPSKARTREELGW